LALIIVGAYIKGDYVDYFSYGEDGSKYVSVSVFIIIVGVIFFVIGFLGCCGAYKENYCMVVTAFAVLLGIIVACVLGFAYRKKVMLLATPTFVFEKYENLSEVNIN